MLVQIQKTMCLEVGIPLFMNLIYVIFLPSPADRFSSLQRVGPGGGSGSFFSPLFLYPQNQYEWRFRTVFYSTAKGFWGPWLQSSRCFAWGYRGMLPWGLLLFEKHWWSAEARFVLLWARGRNSLWRRRTSKRTLCCYQGWWGVLTWVARFPLLNSVLISSNIVG